jgi:hypothetical protein
LITGERCVCARVEVHLEQHLCRRWEHHGLLYNGSHRRISSNRYHNSFFIAGFAIFETDVLRRKRVRRQITLLNSPRGHSSFSALSRGSIKNRSSPFCDANEKARTPAQ